MDILTDIRDFAKEYGLFDTPNIIVGISGGPDSVMLIYALSELRKQGAVTSNIYAVHVNHNLRDEAESDMQLAVSLCNQLNIPCRVYAFDVNSESNRMSRSLEETGRILRYQAFDEFAREQFGEHYADISRIAVAHHKDDLAETMMMNLFRGAGLEGLVSPMPIRGRTIRPLLGITKSEILNYLDKNNICYAIDKTNYENDCTRNVWRNQILPIISEASNKDASAALSDTYKLLYEDLIYIENQVNSIYEANVIRDDAVLFKAECLTGIPLAIGNRVIRRLWEETFGNLTNFESTHVDIARKLFMSGNVAETTVDLSYGRKAFIANGYIGFCDETGIVTSMCAVARKMGIIAYPVKIREQITKLTLLPQTDLHLSVQNVENNGILEYNDLSWFLPVSDEDQSTYMIGTGALDMRFRRAGISGSKNMKDFLSDLKVPRSAREYVLAAYDEKSREILWIPGAGHSKGFTNERSYMRWSEEASSKTISRFIRISF